MQKIRLVASLCLAIALLVACSGSTTTTARTLSPSTPIATRDGAPAGLLAEGQQSGDLVVWLSSVPPPPLGETAQLETTLTTTRGEPVEDAKITYDIDMTNMSHGQYLVQPEAAGAGHYSGKVHFSMGGPWRVIMTIERSGKPTIRLRFEFRVRG